MWIIFAAIAAFLVVVGVYVAVMKAASRGTTTLETPTRDFDPLQRAKDHITDRKVAHVQKETQWKQTVAAYEDADKGIAAQRSLTEQQHRIAEEQNRLTLSQTAAAIRVTNEATNRGLPPLVYEAAIAGKVQVDLDVDRHTRILQANVESKAQEAQLDVQTALTVALVDKHKLLHIQEVVLRLIEQAHDIRTSDKAAEVKNAQLEVMNEVIDGLRRDLRGLQNIPSDNRPGLSGSPENSSDGPAEH